MADLTGAELIAAERHRQIEVEGWTAEHDAGEHDDGQLAAAAETYLREARAPGTYTGPYNNRTMVVACPDGVFTNKPNIWPWDVRWWKPSTPLRMLVKAGALIAAEIDRRLAKGETL